MILSTFFQLSTQLLVVFYLHKSSSWVWLSTIYTKGKVHLTTFVQKNCITNKTGTNSQQIYFYNDTYLQCKFPLFCLSSGGVDTYSHTIWWPAFHKIILANDKCYKICGHDGCSSKLHLYKAVFLWIWLPFNHILQKWTDRTTLIKETTVKSYTFSPKALYCVTSDMVKPPRLHCYAQFKLDKIVPFYIIPMF